MHDDLKRKLDDSMPEDVTLSEAKKHRILKAAQEKDGEWRPSRVPRFLPALAGVAVIGLSGLLAYPYLTEEETDASVEVRNAEENQLPAGENNENPETPVIGNEETSEEEANDASEESNEDKPEEPVEEIREEPEGEKENTDSLQPAKEEELHNLLNHEFFATGIELGDEVAEVESNYPNWLYKGDYEGGVAIQYENFTLFHGQFETVINNVTLSGFDQLTVSKIEEVIEQEIDIVSYFNEIDGRDVISGEFTLENQRYVVVAESGTEDALVEEISMSVYLGE